MQAQPSNVTDTEMSWSVVTTGPYMDMLNIVGLRLLLNSYIDLTSAASVHVWPYQRSA
jgi:hypothetical protein